jgi:hypothetical protein
MKVIVAAIVLFAASALSSLTTMVVVLIVAVAIAHEFVTTAPPNRVFDTSWLALTAFSSVVGVTAGAAYTRRSIRTPADPCSQPGVGRAIVSRLRDPCLDGAALTALCGVYLLTLISLVAALDGDPGTRLRVPAIFASALTTGLSALPGVVFGLVAGTALGVYRSLNRRSQLVTSGRAPRPAERDFAPARVSPMLMSAYIGAIQLAVLGLVAQSSHRGAGFLYGLQEGALHFGLLGAYLGVRERPVRRDVKTQINPAVSDRSSVRAPMAGALLGGPLAIRLATCSGEPSLSWIPLFLLYLIGCGLGAGVAVYTTRVSQPQSQPTEIRDATEMELPVKERSLSRADEKDFDRYDAEELPQAEPVLTTPSISSSTAGRFRLRDVRDRFATIDGEEYWNFKHGMSIQNLNDWFVRELPANFRDGGGFLGLESPDGTAVIQFSSHRLGTKLQVLSVAGSREQFLKTWIEVSGRTFEPTRLQLGGGPMSQDTNFTLDGETESVHFWFTVVGGGITSRHGKVCAMHQGDAFAIHYAVTAGSSVDIDKILGSWHWRMRLRAHLTGLQ